MTPPKCTSRPDCPCKFCTRTREEMAAGNTPGQQLDQIAVGWIRDFSAAEVAKINPEWVAVIEWNYDREEDLRVFGTPLPSRYPRPIPAKYRENL